MSFCLSFRMRTNVMGFRQFLFKYFCSTLFKAGAEYSWFKVVHKCCNFFSSPNTYISKNDFFQVRFSDGLGWEGWADFNPAEVHKQYGVAFKTPKYRDGNLKDMVKVFLELYKPSDESVSEPMDFFFVPQERILSPRQLAQGASQVKSGFPAINGGGARNGSMEVKDFKDLRIKQEMADQQNWSQTRWAIP